MSGSCCGSAKAEPSKAEMAATSQASEPASEQQAAEAQKSECCGGKPAKTEKHRCGCEC